MYRLGHKPQHQSSRKPLWFGAAALVLLIGATVVVVGRQLKPDTTIINSQAVVRKVTPTSTPVKGFDEPAFDVELPADWKLMAHLTTPYNLYRFQGATKANANRILDVYQDTIPVNFMMNRVQPVEANGEKLSVIGSMSENCVDFTKGPSGQQGTPAKWEGVDFLCDLNNYQRNVIGATAKGALNSVTLKGPSGATHKFFFAYTDNSISPNYQTFYSALGSFNTK